MCARRGVYHNRDRSTEGSALPLMGKGRGFKSRLFHFFYEKMNQLLSYTFVLKDDSLLQLRIHTVRSKKIESSKNESPSTNKTKLTSKMKCSICKQEGHNKRSCKTMATPVSAAKIEAETDVKAKAPVKVEMESSNATPAVAPVEKKPSRNKKHMIAYRELGRELPKCVNTGCSRFVSVRHWNDGLIPSLKTECAICATARKNGKTLEGISFAKKDSCENKDGRLGFICPCDQTRYTEYPSDCYHMDHINGNHGDNRPENIMTLCMMCHTMKGKREGDFNGSKTTSLRFAPQVPSSK